MDRKLDLTKYLTDSEVKKLRRACVDWDIADRQTRRATGIRAWMIVDLALQTGLRVAELAALKVEDLDWANGAIKVRRRKKREMVEEYIPLPPRLADHIKNYLEGRTSGLVVLGQRGPLTRRGWQHAWLAACRKAGIRALSIHKARHTVGTILYRCTRDLRLVQMQLGHARPETTAIYADLTFEDRQDGVAKMSKLLGEMP